MAALHQLLQILTYNVMVQKYGVCIEVGVVKIVAYSRANRWQFFYLVVFSFSFLASASQFTNVPLGKRYCVGEHLQSGFPLLLFLHSSSLLYLNPNLVTPGIRAHSFSSFSRVR